MPRQAREQSKSGIYHIMLRGINQQLIYEEAGDYQKFIEILKDCQVLSQFKLYTYCLMGNHVHILLKPQEKL